jgi:hypothetical protein
MIDLVPESQHSYRAGGEVISRRDDPKFPVTLHANRESREVTLKHYRILIQKGAPFHKDVGRIGEKSSNRTICLDPTVDLVYIDFWDLFRQNSGIAELFAQDPSCFEMLRSLEIRNVYCYGSAHVRHGYFVEDFRSARGGALNYFRGLRGLHLTEGTRFSLNHDVEDAMECHKTLWVHMKRRQRKDPPGAQRSIPEITFHDWRRKEARSDLEHLNCARIPYPWLLRENEDGNGGPS